MMKSEGGEVWPKAFRGVRYVAAWLGSRSGTFAGFGQWKHILSGGRLIFWREGLTEVLGWWLLVKVVWLGWRCFGRQSRGRNCGCERYSS